MSPIHNFCKLIQCYVCIWHFLLLCFSAAAIFQDLVAMVTAQDSSTTITRMISSMGNYSAVDCPVDLCLTQFVAYELRMNFSSIHNASTTCMDGQEM